MQLIRRIEKIESAKKRSYLPLIVNRYAVFGFWNLIIAHTIRLFKLATKGLSSCRACNSNEIQFYKADMTHLGRSLELKLKTTKIIGCPIDSARAINSD